MVYEDIHIAGRNEFKIIYVKWCHCCGRTFITARFLLTVKQGYKARFIPDASVAKGLFDLNEHTRMLTTGASNADNKINTFFCVLVWFACVALVATVPSDVRLAYKHSGERFVAKFE